MTAARLGAALLLVGVAACADDPAPGPGGPGGDCRIAVVSSDYASTSVSLLDLEGRLCRDHVVHSGSRPPGIVTALSGDVVLPSGPHPDGLVTLIDRYPNGVLTFFDPDALEVVAQLSVATGFAANPQDAVFLAPGEAWVSRAETNRAATATPADHDDGGDLLRVDPRLPTPAITGRLDLQAAADPGHDPRPARMARAGGWVWVGLEHLSSGWLGGPGVALAIDPATGAVAHRVVVAELANCGRGLSATGAGDGLWLACNGVLAEGPDAQLARSGLAYIDAGAPVPAATWVGRAADLGGRPLGFALAALDGTRVAFVSFGDDAAGVPDALHVLDGPGGAIATVALDADAFELRALLYVPETKLLLVADADPRAPRIHRFEVPPGEPLRALEAIDANPAVGLPPTALGRFR